MASKRVGKTCRVRIDGVLYPYSDAKKDVVIKRELIDVITGVPGKAGQCMNANCIVRNRSKFPHKVLAASVIKSRVYIFDSLVHVVRYVLTSAASRDIQSHDVEKLGRPGVLTLKAPTGNQRAGSTVGGGRNLSKHPKSPLGHPLVRGEQARIIAAVGALSKRRVAA